MKIALKLSLLWVMACGTDAVPSNDECTAAIPLNINAEPTVGTTVNATTQSGGGCGGVAKSSTEVYYTVAGNGKRMTATTCSDATAFPTSLALADGTCEYCIDGSLTDPNCDNVNGASVTWDSKIDTSYTLFVYGRQAASEGGFAISVADYANPTNDYCDRAISILVNGGEVSGSNVNATTQSGAGCGGVAKSAPEVYYTVAGNGKRMTATTCSDATAFATSLALADGACEYCIDGSLTDPNCDNVNGASVTWDSKNGTSYTLFVYGRQAAAEGEFAISVTDYPNPTNDYCDGAIAIFSNGNDIIGSTVNATTQSGVGCGVTKSAPEVYYLVGGTGVSLTVTTCSAHTSFETSLALFDGTCTYCIDGSSTDPNCDNVNGASITWNSTINTMYKIAVFGRQAGYEGDFAIRVFDTDRTPTVSPRSRKPASGPTSPPIFTPPTPLSKAPTIKPTSTITTTQLTSSQVAPLSTIACVISFGFFVMLQ